MLELRIEVFGYNCSQAIAKMPRPLSTYSFR